MATSTMPFRQGRPNESLTTTPTSQPESSRKPSHGCAPADVSGSIGSRTTVSGLGCVRGIDAGRGTDEAVPGLGDDERRSRPDDTRRLPQDHLELPGDRDRRRAPRRGADGSTPSRADDPPLDLRDGLLRDDERRLPPRYAARTAIERTRDRPPRRVRGDPRRGRSGSQARVPRPDRALASTVSASARAAETSRIRVVVHRPAGCRHAPRRRAPSASDSSMTRTSTTPGSTSPHGPDRFHRQGG